MLRQPEFEKAADIQAVAETEAQVARLRAQFRTASTKPITNPHARSSSPCGSGSGEVACTSCTIARPSSGHSRCETPGRWELSCSFRYAQHVHSWRGVCMGGRVPFLDVCCECGRSQPGSGVVEFDRSGSGASDRVDQSTALSCVYERIHSRYGLRGVRFGEASHPGPRPHACRLGLIRRIHMFLMMWISVCLPQ